VRSEHVWRWASHEAPAMARHSADGNDPGAEHEHLWYQWPRRDLGS
jgi:hypothetical protein